MKGWVGEEEEVARMNECLRKGGERYIVLLTGLGVGVGGGV